MENDKKWRKLSGEVLSDGIESEMRRMLVEEKRMGNQIKVCIGTDSQVRENRIRFATVIVILRRGKGGYMYIRDETIRRGVSIKERMLMEVARSVEVAYSLARLLTVYNVDLEVHADINSNPQFRSNDALKEAMGHILGMGFDFKGKPHAFASSACADKAVKEGI